MIRWIVHSCRVGGLATCPSILVIPPFAIPRVKTAWMYSFRHKSRLPVSYHGNPDGVQEHPATIQSGVQKQVVILLSGLPRQSKKRRKCHREERVRRQPLVTFREPSNLSQCYHQVLRVLWMIPRAGPPRHLLASRRPSHPSLPASCRPQHQSRLISDHLATSSHPKQRLQELVSYSRQNPKRNPNGTPKGIKINSLHRTMSRMLVNPCRLSLEVPCAWTSAAIIIQPRVHSCSTMSL
mmetsp:Transcript_24395/g.59734  ORF Transcript_24395/g.59734 Transcript_24395/m.59734 type:complete len:238 (-) Transcript_24395:366-1079(-)